MRADHIEADRQRQSAERAVMEAAIVERVTSRYGATLVAVGLQRSVGGQELTHILWRAGRNGSYDSRSSQRFVSRFGPGAKNEP